MLSALVPTTIAGILDASFLFPCHSLTFFLTPCCCDFPSLSSLGPYERHPFFLIFVGVCLRAFPPPKHHLFFFKTPTSSKVHHVATFHPLQPFDVFVKFWQPSPAKTPPKFSILSLFFFLILEQCARFISDCATLLCCYLPFKASTGFPFPHP